MHTLNLFHSIKPSRVCVHVHISRLRAQIMHVCECVCRIASCAHLMHKCCMMISEMVSLAVGALKWLCGVFAGHFAYQRGSEN